MVATVVGVRVARGGHSTLGTAAKLAHGDHQRLVQQTPLVEIGDQGRESRIEHRAVLGLHPLGQADVDVPRVVVRVGHLGPVDLDHPRARFDQPTSQQAALAKRVLAIPLADFLLLRTQVERVAGTARKHQAQSLVVVLVQSVLLDGDFQVTQAGVDLVSQRRATLQAGQRHFLAKLQIVDVDLVHLGHVHVPTAGVQVVRIVGAAQEPRGPRLADHRTLLQRTRHHHVGQHRDRRRTQLDDVATEVGEVLGAGRLELARGGNLVGRVAGQHHVDRRGVIEQTDRRVAHRTDHRELVVDRRQLRHVLGELNTGQLRVDRLEDTLDVVGHVRLRVPQVQVTRATLQVQHDHVLGLAESGSAVASTLGRRHVLQPQHLRQTQAKRGRAADLQYVATRNAVAQVLPIVSGDTKHRASP